MKKLIFLLFIFPLFLSCEDGDKVDDLIVGTWELVGTSFYNKKTGESTSSVKRPDNYKSTVIYNNDGTFLSFSSYMSSGELVNDNNSGKYKITYTENFEIFRQGTLELQYDDGPNVIVGFNILEETTLCIAGSIDDTRAYLDSFIRK